LIIVLGCLHFVGGPLALVQVIAWSKMIATYSGEAGILVGIQDTFSGDRPCHLCCKIAEARDTQQETSKSSANYLSQCQWKYLNELTHQQKEELSAPPSSVLPETEFTQPLQVLERLRTRPLTPPPRDLV